MELSGRPLFDNPVDAALFVDREEAVRLEANCRDGVNTLLLGGRGIGKTSLMRYVLYRLRESSFPAVGVDAAPAEDVVDLLKLVAAGLGRARLVERRIDAVTAVGLGEIGAVLHELGELRVATEDAGGRTAVLVDLPSGNRAMHRLFGSFRDELWQLPFTWIVVAPPDLRQELLTPPADAFFEDVLELAPLTPEQQAELIRLRLQPGEQTPWRLRSEGEENPRRLLEIVRESVRNGEPVDHRLGAFAERSQEVDRLGDAAARLYSVLETYGPASASDARFLDLLGWSRQRAAQLFKELEQVDLVRAEYLRPDGGRPRKVFSIVPPPNR